MTATTTLTKALAEFAKVKPRDSASSAALASGKEFIRQAQSELVVPTPEPTPPTPPPAPEPEPTPPPGVLLFSGHKRADFPEKVEGHTGAITDVADPLGQLSGTVLKLDTRSTDVAPKTPTENPRSELLTKNILQPGSEYWLHTKFMVEEDFPAVPGWLTLLSIYVANGPGEPAPWHIQINNDAQLDWERIKTYGWDVPFTMPLPKGEWVDVLHHTLLSESGWVETWINGQQISFKTNSYSGTKLPMKTIDKTANPGPNYAKLCNYRKAGMYNEGPIYFTGLDIGTTREVVGA